MAGLPTGVEIHNGKIRIWFSYRETRCREVLKGWLTTSSNIKKAGNLRASIVSDIQMGTFDYAARFPESKTAKKFCTTTQKIATFHELREEFLKIKKLEVSASTHDSLRSRTKTLMNVIGANTLITDIQYTDVLRYRQLLLTGEVTNEHMPWLNKKGRNAKTTNGIIATLCNMLRIANQSQFIDHSPHENIKMLKVSKRVPDPLLPHEYQKALTTWPPTFVLMWMFAVHSGLRHGELRALAWEDVDFEKGEVHVSRNITSKNLFVPPKTDAGIRTITLLAPALEALKRQFKVTGNGPAQEITFHHREPGRTENQALHFVFSSKTTSRKKNRFYSKGAVESSWKVGLRKAGIRHRNPYQSRHTYACWLLTAGANPSFISSQMGHENARMVYEVYSKWISEMSANQVDMLNQKLSGEVPPPCP